MDEWWEGARIDDGCVDGWTDGWLDVLMYGWVDECMDG